MMGKVLLLRALSKQVKDAARAIGRIETHKVTAKTLTDLVGIGVLIVTEYGRETQEEKEILDLFCEHEHKVAMCLRC